MMKDHFRAYFEPRGQSWRDIASAAFVYFLSRAIYNAYPLPQQMSGTRRALAYTGNLVSRGFNPIVFPEGLRTPDGRIRIPIVPIRIRGLYWIYSVHDSWPRRGPIRVSIGPPLKFPADADYEHATRRVEEALNGL